jgi:hypothetical protein
MMPLAGRRPCRLATPGILAALSLGIMMPRLLQARFGLLDDGVTIYVARALGGALQAADPGLVFRLELERGRFRPFYWLFEAAQYAIWGPSATGFFIGNALALLATALAVAGTVWVVTADRPATLLAGVAYLLSPVVVEGYYTLSKPEVPLALSLGISWWAWAGARAEADRDPRRSRRMFALSAGALFVAYFTKETAQAMLVVSALGLAASRLAVRTGHASTVSRVDRRYLAVNVAWTALFWVARLGAGTAAIAAGDDSHRYAVTGVSIVSSALGQAIWYARDFPLLVPLLAFLAWPRTRPTWLDPWLVRVAVCWIAAWTAIMLPWPTIYEYFLLPASVAAAVLTGLGASAVARALRAPRRSVRLPARVLLAAMLLCVPVALANAVTNARVQIAADDANGRLVDFLAQQLPPAGTVLVDLPAPNEYVPELGAHLALLKGRQDVAVRYRQGDGSRPAGAVFIAAPHMLNRPLPGVRLPVSEVPPARDGEAARRYGGNAILVHRVTRTSRLLATPVPAAICSVLERARAYAPLFCGRDGHLLDRREFTYGWEVYRIDAH